MSSAPPRLRSWLPAMSCSVPGHMWRHYIWRKNGWQGRRNSEVELAQRLEPLGHPVPRGVAHDHGQHDHADSLRHDEAEQKVQHGHEGCEHEQLTELDAYVESEQRREHVVARELQSVAQAEREAEAVNQP